MLFPWHQVSLLALEASEVIHLRLMKLAGGGWDAIDEVNLMVSEKLNAAIEAGGTILVGGSASAVVDRYREHVAANSKRLSLV
jgi:hypothetical protein